MLQQDKRGFALLEVVVAILIIGIMISIGAPRFFRGRTTNFTKFVVSLNTLMQDALQLAIEESKVVKVNFNFKNKVIELKKLDKKETLKNSILIPDGITIEQLFINQKEEPGHDEAWIYVNQNGIAQEFIINFTLEDNKGKKIPKSLVLNPFTVQFKIYDTFSKSKK